MQSTSLADLFSWADPALVPLFHLLGAPVTTLELLAFVLSLWMVGCNLRVHVAGWLLAIFSSLLYGVFFARGKLYGEACLQLVFVAVSIWGWLQWLAPAHARAVELTGSGGLPDPATRGVQIMSRRQRWLWMAAALALWPLMGAALDHFTDSDVPYLDAFPTTFSLLGQYLLGRKWVENWPIWVVVNVASMGLFAHRGYWLTVVLYSIFAVLSVWGWRQWLQLSKRAA